MTPLYQPVECCRVCRDKALTSVVDLGVLALTGVFPKLGDPETPKGPLRIVRCDACGLVQLADRYDLSKLYGDTYGYRSGLNAGMVRHLKDIVSEIESRVSLAPGDRVVDIGSNDGTLLGQFAEKNLKKLGVDPSAEKFRKYYSSNTDLLVDFFPSPGVADWLAGTKAKVITSIACFYDLEDPVGFARAIRSQLADDGVWVFEQSYLPAMLAANAFDTICHEHVEYYSLAVIAHIVDASDMQINSVSFDDTNGGSFQVWAAPKGSASFPVDCQLEKLLNVEVALELHTDAPWEKFRASIVMICAQSRAFLEVEAAAGRLVLGYGASTKGNVLLQSACIEEDTLSAILEVNEDKFGSRTPGGNIEIISETDGMAREPSALFVLPWHFRESIVKREAAFLKGGGRLVFPMPLFEIVEG